MNENYASATEAPHRLLYGESDKTSERSLTPEAIAAIENMDTPVYDKVEYLLTASGVKPASEVTIQAPPHLDALEDALPTMPDEIVEEYVRVAQLAGLSIIIGPAASVGLKSGLRARTLTFFVGSSPENTERLKNAVVNQDPYRHALALGYPETAADAFAYHRQDTINPTHIPGLPPEVVDYTGFLLSRGNYTKELETPALWERTIRELSPRVHAEVAQRRRSVHTNGLQTQVQPVEGDTNEAIARFTPAESLLSEAITELEGVPIDIAKKRELLLTALGYKPTSVVHLSTFEGLPGAPRQRERCEDVVNIARDLGLHVHVAGEQISVGISDEDVASLDHALIEQDTRTIGTLLGYPPGAVDAFARGVKGISAAQFVNDPHILAFARFSLSPEHFREDIRTAEAWGEAIKLASPKLYEQMIEAYESLMQRAAAARSAQG